MKYILLLLLSASLFVSCGSSKGIQLSSVNQQECENDKTESAVGFAGETVQNIIFDHQGNVVFTTLTVKTRCGSNIELKLEDKSPSLRIKLRDTNKSQDDCVCLKKVTGTFENIKPGTYNVEVTNSSGSDLYITGSFSVLPE